MCKGNQAKVQDSEILKQLRAHTKELTDDYQRELSVNK